MDLTLLEEELLLHNRPVDLPSEPPLRSHKRPVDLAPAPPSKKRKPAKAPKAPAEASKTKKLKPAKAPKAPAEAPRHRAADLAPSLAPARGRLVDHLDRTRPEVQQLMTQGFCVLKGVLSPQQVEEARAGLWDDSEALGTGLLRNDEATWETKNAWPISGHGLTQQAGWGLFRGMCAARNMTESAWTALFNGQQPIASWDCAAIATPKYQKNMQHRWRDSKVKAVPSWLHVDQSPSRPELLRHVQGMLALYDAGPAEMSTVLIAPRDGESAQSLRDRFLAAFPEDPLDTKHQDAEKREWYKYSTEEKQWLADNGRVLKPELEKGDMLLWASGVAHASGLGGLAVGQTERGLRMSLAISCVPLALVSSEELAFRQAFLNIGLTSGHRVAEKKRNRKGFDKCSFPAKGNEWGGIKFPEYNTERRLGDFRTRRLNDKVHTDTARFCGGFEDAPVQLSVAARWAEF